MPRLCRVTLYCLVTIFVMNGGLQEFTNMFNTKHGMSCVICHCQLLVFIFVIVSMTGQCIVMVICSQQCLVLCIPFVFNLLYTKLGLGNCWPKSEGVWNIFSSSIIQRWQTWESMWYFTIIWPCYHSSMLKGCLDKVCRSLFSLLRHPLLLQKPFVLYISYITFLFFLVQIADEMCYVCIFHNIFVWKFKRDHVFMFNMRKFC